MTKDSPPDTKTHMDAEDINIPEVEKFLTAKGYRNIDLWQHWRNVVGSVEKDGKKQFFKLASTPVISARLKNEAAWNNLVNSSEYDFSPFSFPQIYEVAEFNGLSYYLGEWIDGQLLAEQDAKENLEKIYEYLDQIINGLNKLQNFQPYSLLPADEDRILRMYQYKLVQAARSWDEKVRDKVSLKPLIDFIESHIQFLHLEFLHNEFVPWSFMVTDDGLVLFDSEHGTAFGPRHHDAITFYHRLFTYCEDKELASLFLKKYIESAIQTDEDLNCLQLTMASRLCGGYWESSDRHWSTLESQNELRDQLLSGDWLDLV